MKKTVDLGAISRVATRVELKSVRLTEIVAKCGSSSPGTLVPTVNLECRPGVFEAGTLEVECECTFTARSENIQAVESKIIYSLVYEIGGGVESPSNDDLTEFARANGTLNSWPFVREILFGLTSRMGYPPYTLPLMHFEPKATQADAPNLPLQS